MEVNLHYKNCSSLLNLNWLRSIFIYFILKSDHRNKSERLFDLQINKDSHTMNEGINGV